MKPEPNLLIKMSQDWIKKEDEKRKDYANFLRISNPDMGKVIKMNSKTEKKLA
jgi:hypothetical protein